MIITREDLHAWLSNQPGDHVVGHRAQSCMCPIAGFLMVKTGVIHVVFSGEHHPLSEPDVKFIHHSWLVEFILEVDCPDIETDEIEVTATEALQILEGISHA